MAVGLIIGFAFGFTLYDRGRKPCSNRLVRSQMCIMRRLLPFYIRERFKQPITEQFLSRRLFLFQPRQLAHKISSRSEVLPSESLVVREQVIR